MITITEQENMVQAIDAETSWEELASVINFATQLQGKALEVAINKGLAEGLIQSEIIEKLRDAGCTLGNKQLYQQIQFHEFKIELSFSPHVDSDLNIPETEAQFRGLEGGSALEKAELFTDIQGESERQPTQREMNNAREVMRKAEALARQKNKRKTPEQTFPKYMTPEQITDFDEWFQNKTGKTREEMKPKINFREVMDNKDLIINELSKKESDWKKARKQLFEFSHPDKNGEAVVFQFVKLLDDLMKDLSALIKYGQYQIKIKKYKEQWWTTKEQS